MSYFPPTAKIEGEFNKWTLKYEMPEGNIYYWSRPFAAYKCYGETQTVGYGKRYLLDFAKNTKTYICDVHNVIYIYQYHRYSATERYYVDVDDDTGELIVIKDGVRIVVGAPEGEFDAFTNATISLNGKFIIAEYYDHDSRAYFLRFYEGI
ncbi:MAG: hypothetical protein QXK24_02175 [Ignisphaera sp.]